MPGITGFQFVEMLEESTLLRDKKPYIILYSTVVSPDDERMAVKYKSVDRIIEKPITYTEFKNLYIRHINTLPMYA